MESKDGFQPPGRCEAAESDFVAEPLNAAADMKVKKLIRTFSTELISLRFLSPGYSQHISHNYSFFWGGVGGGSGREEGTGEGAR